MLTEQTTTPFTDLKECLDDFRRRFNTNERARKLVKNWDRHVLVDATDTGVAYTMYIEGQELKRVEEGRPEGGDEFLVHLQATQATLIEIFSGKYNPSTALLDGMLAVFSNDRDKVKLEACAMVIWGL